jgi:hypothetical protein
MTSKFKFIPIDEALKITGHATPGALDQWIRRFNVAHPETLIRKRCGCVNLPDLERALEIETEKFTPGARRAKTLKKEMERIAAK